MDSLILKRISDHKTVLETHAFCTHLRNTDDLSFSFVPAMTFLVFGFKDMLTNIQPRKPRSDTDCMIALHCQEDSDHWSWFLQDMEVLHMDIDYWGGDISSALQNLWSPNYQSVRNLVYCVMRHINNTTSHKQTLTIIECLEAAFSVFIAGMNVLTQKAKLHHKLRYLGEQHYKKESNHSMGSWIENNRAIPDDKSDSSYTSPTEQRQALHIADEIFSGFTAVFDCWYSVCPEQNTHKTKADNIIR